MILTRNKEHTVHLLDILERAVGLVEDCFEEAERQELYWLLREFERSLEFEGAED